MLPPYVRLVKSSHAAVKECASLLKDLVERAACPCTGPGWGSGSGTTEAKIRTEMARHSATMALLMVSSTF